MSKQIDMAGKIFGRWNVLEIAGSDKRGERLWNCRCLCGRESVITGSSLRSGNSSSCGCYRSENPHRKTHGASLTQEYQAWKAMIRRCENKNAVEYKDYGGRGIGVCQRWRRSFESFIEDMGERPEGRTLERKNNDGNYELENCRWATKYDQANNTRSNRILSLCGEKKTMSQWSREYGIKVGTIWKRLSLGWTEESAIKTPCKNRGGLMELSELKRIKAEKENEIRMSLNDLEDLTGIRGMGVEVFRAGKEIMEVKIKVDL